MIGLRIVTICAYRYKKLVPGCQGRGCTARSRASVNSGALTGHDGMF